MFECGDGTGGVRLAPRMRSWSVGRAMKLRRGSGEERLCGLSSGGVLCEEACSMTLGSCQIAVSTLM